MGLQHNLSELDMEHHLDPDCWKIWDIEGIFIDKVPKISCGYDRLFENVDAKKSAKDISNFAITSVGSYSCTIAHCGREWF